MGYIYKAACYCDDCGEEIRKQLKSEGKAPEDELDYYSYDSDDYPKDSDVEHDESDCPEHCDQCYKFLHNPLTSDGYKYVQAELNECGATTIAALSDTLQEWASWYDFDYWTSEDCAEDGRHTVPGWYSRQAY